MARVFVDVNKNATLEDHVPMPWENYHKYVDQDKKDPEENTQMGFFLTPITEINDKQAVCFTKKTPIMCAYSTCCRTFGGFLAHNWHSDSVIRINVDRLQSLIWQLLENRQNHLCLTSFL